MTLTTVLLQAAAPATTSGGFGGSSISSIIMMVAIVAVFYFFMIRPQAKKQKEIRKFRESLAVGDKVITAGGIHGKIKDIKDDSIIIEIAENVRIRVDKGSIYASAADSAQQQETK